jgi:hypothetical protein
MRLQYCTGRPKLIHSFVLGGVPADDKALFPASLEELQDNSTPRSQHGQWSHTSSNSSVIDFKGQRVCMWLLGFNRCQDMTMDESGVNQAVDTYFVNDPYYPRPPTNLRIVITSDRIEPS